MKKKILALALLVVILVTAVTGATLAYFTDSDEATNVFTVGDVDVELVEKMQAADGSIVPWQSSALPLVDPYSGPYPLNKIVMVKNTGENDAYIRVHFKYEAALDPVLIPIQNYGVGGVNVKTSPVHVTENGIDYVVYTIDITNPVKAGYYFPDSLGVTADKELTDMFDCLNHALVQGVMLDSSFDWVNKDYGWFSYGNGDNKTVVMCDYGAPSFEVTVTAEAIQAEGFKNVTEAFAAFDNQNG